MQLWTDKISPYREFEVFSSECKRTVRRMAGPFILLLAVPLLYPAIFAALDGRVLFGGHADLNNIWGIINHLLKTDWAHLYELPIFQPRSGMLASGHTLLGLYPFFKLFQILGFDLIWSHTLYLICALYLNALGHFLLLRRLRVSRSVALVLSVFTLVWGLNAVHFIWLNFLSLFWLPFCLFFLIRWYEKPGWPDGIMAALCSGMLFSACEYYGIHWYLLFMPALVLVLLAVHRKKIGSWLSLLAPFILTAAGILVLYLPLLNRGREIAPAGGFDPSHLLGAGDLFCYSQPLRGIFPSVVIRGHSLYLGVGMAALLFLFFAAPCRRGMKAWGLLMLFYVAAAVIFFVSPFWLDWLTLVLLLTLGVLYIFRVYRKTDLWGRFSGFISTLFIIILWWMPQIDPTARFSLYRLIWENLPGFGGLRAYDRVFPLILPFLLIMAARGVQMLSERGGRRNMINWLLAGALLLMVGEHHYRVQFSHLAPPPFREEVYRTVPSDECGTLLELPLYQGVFGQVQNARYMVNQVFHDLSLIGGRTTHPPEGYYKEVLKLIDHGRLDERSLRRLLDEHSLRYVIVHWDWLNQYYGADSAIVSDIGGMPRRLASWLTPMYESERSSLYRVVDAEEQSVFMRTFSRGQLLGAEITVTIISGDPAWLEWSLSGTPPRRTEVPQHSPIHLTPGRISEGKDLVLIIRCDRPVRLDIRVAHPGGVW